ncbi:DUF6438 domain-containing protein [Sphingomonas montana]|uniref:DUF6438 domain-containing protein n=1 Tax=Sphingomonas montana TaxID=1843236 RepID=UPI00101ADDEC|nr:DUF6438 domain-containing protein [Sphingomonas montana]
MIRLMGFSAGAALALTGCATSGPVATLQTPAPPQAQIQAITYATTPCHGFCPVYSVTIAADGTGTFTGTRNTAVTGERRFTVRPAQAAAFFARLQPYLPTGELLLNGPDACNSYASDLPSADVTWRGAGGSGHLVYDYGCDRDEHRQLADALRAAPTVLPIAELIGRR